MSLKEVMHPVLECVSDSTTVLEASQRMARLGYGALVVGAPGAIKGIITERDVLYKVVAQGINPSTTAVGSVMSSPVEVISVSVAPDDALKKMDQFGYRHLPVVDERGLAIGMLSIRDLFHFIVKRQSEENEALLQFLSADGSGG